ncbi:MAG: transposase, partial [Bacteroidota bacterium]
VRSTGKEKSRVTCMIAVSMSGAMLKPMVILKGKSIGRLRNFTPSESARQGIALSCSEKAWMTTPLMESWISRCLLPYTRRQPAILLMDNFSVHRHQRVTEYLSAHNVHVVWIPPNCTAVAQPCDLRINAQVKRSMRKLWRDRMQKLVSETEDRIPSPSRELLLDWVIEALKSCSSELIRSAWKTVGFEVESSVESWDADDLAMRIGTLDLLDDDFEASEIERESHEEDDK